MNADQRPFAEGTKLQAPLAKLLRPLVRLLIKAGMTYPALCDLLRELYIDVAENEFALPEKPQTNSRVSLLTGIHRKEVSRLRGGGAPITITPASVSRSSQILALWLGSPTFTDSRGAPVPLFRSADLGSPSFDQLVISVTKDVRPRAVFDEWLDSGRIAIDEDNRIILLASALTPSTGDDQLYYFSRNLHDHMAAAAANITDNAAPFLERAVHYDRLSPESAAALVKFSREQANEMLLAANREALSICDADGGGGKRWTCGVYVYCADEQEAAPLFVRKDEPRRGKAPDFVSGLTQTEGFSQEAAPVRKSGKSV
jgi:hypothetical protein